MKIEFDADFEVIGIASQLKDFQMAYLIAKNLVMNFARIADLLFLAKDKTTTLKASAFCAMDTFSNSKLVLFSNKVSNEYLLPELPKFDYILKVNLNNELSSNYIVEQLKKSEDIITIVPIQKFLIKHINKLDFDEEEYKDLD